MYKFIFKFIFKTLPVVKTSYVFEKALQHKLAAAMQSCELKN